MTETLTRRSGYAEATGRPAVMATRGMVATSHYLASAAGLAMLQRGGSAVDACIAANATLCVTYGHMAGLGGDTTSPASRLHMTRSETYRWLVRNAGRFGFVPYVYEPWHWEWVSPTGGYAAAGP